MTSLLQAIEFSRGILRIDRVASGETATQKSRHTEARGCETSPYPSPSIPTAFGIGFLIGRKRLAHLNFGQAVE